MTTGSSQQPTAKNSEFLPAAEVGWGLREGVKQRAGDWASERGGLREEGALHSRPGSQTSLRGYRKYTVRLGDHSLKKKDGSEQEMAVAQSIPHPCYNSSTEDHSHDLMLLRLRGRASRGPRVKPISLADHCPPVGQKCTISGWGTVTSPRGSGRERRSWLAHRTPSH